MSRHYLNVPFAQKDAAKSLGARFDGSAKRWYVEEGRDLSVFARWLPTELAGAAVEASGGTSTGAGLSLALPAAGGDLDLPAGGRGIALSRLLDGVAGAVAQAFAQGVWTLVEVVEARARGHVYLEVSERDGSGQPIAKARAMIWSSTAARILPVFERDTGAVIGAGIKLLVRARPVFHSQFGFSLEIDAIDSEYTLGDLEARKREIRERLQREGVFELNRRLAAPWDYRCVLVVAPEEGAGLGDFRKEAERLERFGICRFVYVYSRFQGEGAARQITSAMAAALERFDAHQRPDAIVIIRGGGAVNDLAWLNDYDLARFICDQDIPVLTGIGHERDNTVPDEVAHTRFDTPSKVIAGIEQQIVLRAREAKAAAEAVFATSAALLQRTHAALDRLDVQIKADALAHVARARHGSAQAMSQVSLGSMRQVHDATAESTARWSQVRGDAHQHLAVAQRRAPALLQEIRGHSREALGAARSATGLDLQAVLGQARAANRAAGHAVHEQLQRVAERAQGRLQAARAESEALLREISGQGPDKTLARGFAIVRAPDGTPVTAQAQAGALPTLEIQFRDGRVAVRPDETT